MRHVAASTLCMAHPPCQGAIGTIELCEIGVILAEQTVEERHLRLNAPVLVDPHPFAIEFRFYWLRRYNRAAAAPRRKLPNDNLGSLRVDPQKDGVRGLVDAPFRLIMPERIRKLARRQPVSKTCLQSHQIHTFSVNILKRVLAAEHEEREVEAGDHIRRELGKVRFLEHCTRIL